MFSIVGIKQSIQYFRIKMIDFDTIENLSLRSIFILILRINMRLENFYSLKEDKSIEARTYKISNLQIVEIITGKDNGGPNLFTSIVDVHIAESFSKIHDDLAKNQLFTSGHYLLNACSLTEYCEKKCPGVVPFHYYSITKELLKFSINCINFCLFELEKHESDEVLICFLEDVETIKAKNNHLNVEVGDDFSEASVYIGMRCDLGFHNKYEFTNEPLTNSNNYKHSRRHKYLFKYTSKLSLEKIFNFESLRFTPLSEFNDPFEGRISRIYRYKGDELIHEVKKILKSHINGEICIPSISEPVSALRSEYKIDNDKDLAVALKYAFHGFLTNYEGFALESRDIKDPKKQVPVMSLIAVSIALFELEGNPKDFTESKLIGFIDDIFKKFEGTNRVFKGDPIFNVEQMKLLSENINVLCLSANENSKLMWSHYADEHKGVLIKINTEKCNVSLLKNLKKVGYQSSVPSSYTVKHLARKYLGFKDELNSNFLFETLSTKSEDWSYEKEWRAFNRKPFLDKNGTEKINFDIIDAIYFGCRSDYHDIMNFIKKFNLLDIEIDFYFSEIDSENFQINYYPFSNSRIRNKTKHLSKQLNKTYSFILDSAFKSLKGEYDENIMKIISIGKLLDVRKFDAIAKLELTYSTIKTVNQKAREVEESILAQEEKERQKRATLKEFIVVYDELKDLLAKDLGEEKLMSMI